MARRSTKSTKKRAESVRVERLGEDVVRVIVEAAPYQVRALRDPAGVRRIFKICREYAKSRLKNVTYTHARKIWEQIESAVLPHFPEKRT